MRGASENICQAVHCKYALLLSNISFPSKFHLRLYPPCKPMANVPLSKIVEPPCSVGLSISAAKRSAVRLYHAALRCQCELENVNVKRRSLYCSVKKNNKSKKNSKAKQQSFFTAMA